MVILFSGGFPRTLVDADSPAILQKAIPGKMGRIVPWEVDAQ
jgi:hypothetical protein